MLFNRRTLLGVALGASLDSASGADAPEPDSMVPANHWAYDVLQQFQAWSVIDLPTGTVSGKLGYTRRQFAGFTADVAEGVDWYVQQGWPWLRTHIRHGRRPDTLTQLAHEFATELALTHVDLDRIRACCARFARLWADGRPQGIRVPFIQSLRRHDALMHDRGRKEAHEFWNRGEPYLWVNDKSVRRRPTFGRAIPLRSTEVSSEAGAEIQRIAGHNEETWRLLRDTAGLPKDRLAWIRKLSDLEALWTASDRTVRLDSRHPGAIVPNIGYRVVWDYPRVGVRDRWDRFEELPDGRIGISRNERRAERCFFISYWAEEERGLHVPADHLVSDHVELRWGPTDTGVVLLRMRVNDPGKPHRIYALDLQSRGLLGAVATD